MPVWLTLLVYALAHARLTGLITQDQITRPARDAVLKRLNDTNPLHQHVAYLLTCAWCSGLWVALPLAPLATWHADVSLAYAPALVLAYSFVTGATSDLGRR